MQNCHLCPDTSRKSSISVFAHNLPAATPETLRDSRGQLIAALLLMAGIRASSLPRLVWSCESCLLQPLLSTCCSTVSTSPASDLQVAWSRELVATRRVCTPMTGRPRSPVGGLPSPRHGTQNVEVAPALGGILRSCCEHPGFSASGSPRTVTSCTSPRSPPRSAGRR